ncbi:MAG: response regulator [Oscillospiraceae bacterium]
MLIRFGRDKMEHQNNQTMLIVDDIAINRIILSKLFSEKYNILEAQDGMNAIDILIKYGEAINIILLDIIMPVMDGFGMLKEMNKLGFSGRIPVVMITSETSESVMQRGYEMGVADIISKPFSPNITRQRINNIVEQYTYRLHLEKLVQQQTTALRTQSIKLRESSTQMIDILSAIIEFKNTESVSHIQNIRTLTKLLMNELLLQHNEFGLSSDLVDIISDAAAMHDIGKIAIPDHILNKPGKLTTEEFEIMKTHTIRGCEILEKLSSVHLLDYYNYCYEICRHHHERWDGNGYPDGLVGNETPIWAQVVSLADVYDALTSKRVYKQAYSAKKSINMILAGDCGLFNPVLLECFVSISKVLIQNAAGGELTGV